MYKIQKRKLIKKYSFILRSGEQKKMKNARNLEWKATSKYWKLNISATND